MVANSFLNVGPLPNGRIQPEPVERLQEIGAWRAKCHDAIYDTQGVVDKGRSAPKRRSLIPHRLPAKLERLTASPKSTAASASFAKPDVRLRLDATAGGGRLDPVRMGT